MWHFFLYCNWQEVTIVDDAVEGKRVSLVFISVDKPQTYSADEIEWKILSLRMREAVSFEYIEIQSVRTGVHGRKYVTAIICRPFE